MPRHIVIKMTQAKDKETVYVTAKEKRQKNKQKPICLSDLSAETLQVRGEWHDIFRAMKEKNLKPRIFYPARPSFRFTGEIKSFTDKKKKELRELPPID